MRQLDRRLHPEAPVDLGETRFSFPDWSKIHRELRNRGGTLTLLWLEYKTQHPDEIQYTWFRKLFRTSTAKLHVLNANVWSSNFALYERRCEPLTSGTMMMPKQRSSTRTRSAMS